MLDSFAGWASAGTVAVPVWAIVAGLGLIIGALAFRRATLDGSSVPLLQGALVVAVIVAGWWALDHIGQRNIAVEQRNVALEQQAVDRPQFDLYFALRSMIEIARRFDRREEPPSSYRLAEQFGTTDSQIARVLRKLEDGKLVAQTGGDWIGYVPACDPDRITIELKTKDGPPEVVYIGKKVDAAVVDSVALECYELLKPGCYAGLKVVQQSCIFPAAVVATPSITPSGLARVGRSTSVISKLGKSAARGSA